MNKFQTRIIDMAKKTNSKIIIPEKSDNRVQKAIVELKGMGFDIINIDDYQHKMEYYVEYIHNLSFTKNWPSSQLEEYLSDALHFSMVMVACGDADGVIAGAVTSSSEVIRSAIRLIGISNESKWVSSIFFLISPCGNHAYTFADCAVIPEPDPQQLAVIGNDSANFHELLSGEDARVAFLSFSTKGSAKHYRVEKVLKAISIFEKKYPNIVYDGELQLDAAIVPEISKIKAPNSPVGGMANVLIFPNLDAGNIAYKITEKLGNFSAWGPLLQGLKKPIHDLSRGCSVDDIINVAAITSMQKGCHAYI
ncbi:MAG: phosphate acyltransferase [Candidatus Neomarinimicrobiota bacterium]|nr:phosphate acyltransferase [Candidatus Neomarinimicrobiota bacterium]|tara:strand:+ start:1113 stop:2036 length:924 start_codon:yes stop_codon:yes gene_type:complete